MVTEKPVLIIGAGIVGLCLANGLKQRGIPFEVYERDAAIDSRGQGWAITIHWALPHLQELLPPEVFQAVLDTQVDPEIGRNDTGNFLFLNLETLEPKFRIPPNTRKRVNREKMRRALLEGVKDHVHWSKRLVATKSHAQGAVAVFQDGTQIEGYVVVGAEGSNSRTRQILLPNAYKNYQLPIRFTGVSIDMTAEQVRPLRELDPLLFQGSHPGTGTFLWVSMLDVPKTNGTQNSSGGRYRVQINLSWQVKCSEDEVASDNAAKLAQMGSKARGFHSTLSAAIDAIPTETEVLEIKLTDWPCPTWDNQGRMTLIGDAAHAMTMYRGEAANHGILDAYELLLQLNAVHHDGKSVSDALQDYETAMRDRAQTGVLLSRQACLDAHDFDGLNEQSAVLKRRAISGV